MWLLFASSIKTKTGVVIASSILNSKNNLCVHTSNPSLYAAYAPIKNKARAQPYNVIAKFSNLSCPRNTAR